MLCLALMGRAQSAADVLPLIEQARSQALEGRHGGG
jgi:hypothetical protein